MTIDWKRVRGGCPRCGNPYINYHSLTWWCGRCGIARNWSSKLMPDGWSFPPTRIEDPADAVDDRAREAMHAHLLGKLHLLRDVARWAIEGIEAMPPGWHVNPHVLREAIEAADAVLAAPTPPVRSTEGHPRER